MPITFRQIDSASLPQVDRFNPNSIVHSQLVLHVEDNKISYSIVPLEPYEKILSIDPEDCTTFIDNPQKIIFFADVDGVPAGQIKMVSWWNKFAYVEDLTVDTHFRGKGVGRALMRRTIKWAKEQGFPGVMLETQDNNVPACTLYQNCGFVLGGFDRHVYKAMNPDTKETALYWYLIF